MPDFPYRSRRTIKPAQMEADRPIDDLTLRALLEDAIWAPTHGLTQPWRFQVFTGPARERLAEALVEVYDRSTPAAERREDKRAKLRAQPLAAPVVIAVAAYAPPGGRISALDELAATCCAVQNLLLSGHQRGLGAFWATPPVACSPAFAAWLGLDGDHRSLGLIYLGYPQAGIYPTSSRLPLAERVAFHTA